MSTLLPIVLATGYSFTNAQQLTALETCAQQCTLPYLTETLLDSVAAIISMVSIPRPSVTSRSHNLGSSLP